MSETREPPRGWSVLRDRAREGVREAIEALGAAELVKLSRTIGDRVLWEMAAELDPFFSRGLDETARVDIYDAEVRGDVLTLRFVADYYSYNFAQSGSDWADHYVYAGQAVLTRGELGEVTFANERKVHLTERDTEDYVPRETVRAVLAALLERTRPR